MNNVVNPQTGAVRDALITLSSGHYFDLRLPRANTVTIEDIAKGLSNTCRFGGQCDRYYSVAEHSVLASTVAAHGFEYEALMHDAAEALIGDIPKPLKRILPDYCKLETRIEAVIAKRFGFSFPMPAEVKKVDIEMLAAEKKQVMGNFDDWADTRGWNDAAVDIEFWSPKFAYANFLARYRELGGV